MNGKPERGDAVEGWLEACILGFRAADDECSRITLKAMLEHYRLQADHDKFLWEVVEES